ncbi:IS4 family transposase [Actinosynnema sp. NPDC023587]|uniref:IS4 family transposase n=1 Tax=Actinosynnema sp. NPDC023587 TaxID=3154695 RepID=UPI0033DF93F7
MAGGRFAPGHLGELTRIVPFEMVDDVLAATGKTQARVRDLPSRVVVYLLPAAGLFAESGYRQVWARLVAGLDGLPVAMPTSSALAQARRRVGAAPLRALFALVAGPAAGAARWRGLLVCAIDGTTMSVPDTPANLAAHTRQTGSHGGSGHPLLRLVAVVACGTRTVIDAVFGPIGVGETTQAPHLLKCLRPGMLLSADRNFAVAGLLARIAATGAQALIRCKNSRPLPDLALLSDGSRLSRMGGVAVRVVDADITVTLTGGNGAPAATGWSPPCSTTTTTTPPATSSPSTTSAGRSRPPTWN